MQIFDLKPPNFREFDHFSEMRNDALMHREDIIGHAFEKLKESDNGYYSMRLAIADVCHAGSTSVWCKF